MIIHLSILCLKMAYLGLSTHCLGIRLSWMVLTVGDIQTESIDCSTTCPKLAAASDHNGWLFCLNLLGLCAGQSR